MGRHCIYTTQNASYLLTKHYTNPQQIEATDLWWADTLGETDKEITVIY